MIEAIIIFIAIILGFLNVFGSEPLTAFKEGILPSPEPIQQEAESPGTIPSYNEPSNTQAQQPTLGAATKIVYGPRNGEILNETNEVTFEFDWKDSSQNRENSRFETKVEGFDNDWTSSYSNERTITLPAGPKEYTFMVRERGQPNQTPAKRTFKINVSPYFEKIEIENIQTQTMSQPSLITLETNFDRGETINMTGWKIEGKRQSFTFPKAIEKYHPVSNNSPSNNMVIRQEDTIYISSASSPLGPAQVFKLNKCFGYLLPLYSFPISVPKECPEIRKRDIEHLEDRCQEYLLSAPPCEAQKDSYTLKQDCRDYISNNLSYQGCFFNYSQDNDFLGDEWHAYLGFNMAITGECNTIYLKDQNGLFVDKYPYNQEECQY